MSHNELDWEVRKAFSEKVTSKQRTTRYMGIKQDKHGRGGDRERFQGEVSTQRAPGAQGACQAGSDGDAEKRVDVVGLAESVQSRYLI